MDDFVQAEGIAIGQIIHALRVAVTGKAVGFGVFETLAILGKDRSLEADRPGAGDGEMNDDWTNEEWQAWYRLTPQERMDESAKILQLYLSLGGSLAPEYDQQSSFNELYYPSNVPEKLEGEADECFTVISPSRIG